jgi:two-component system sensor histidine kinase KdpD
MNDSSPDPDAILARWKTEASMAQRGHLKIFFGYAAGVGKTYAMLEAAHRARESGRDVVIGYIEPHARPATAALVEGLESIPTRVHAYQGVVLREFDVDAAIQRRPEIVLVDELAHHNADGCRHTKRWQDVEELLEAGIDVWTTLNVQHIESLNDIVGQISGVQVRETIPDHVFDRAHEIEILDLPPDDLIERIEEGLIYPGEQARKALSHFFDRTNLNALREMSLRQAASRVHLDVQSDRQKKEDARPWATAEQLLVCVGPSPTTAKVIRTAKRMATALDARWIAASVDTPRLPRNTGASNQLMHHFRLAERLGAETITLSGPTVASAILEYAKSRNVTKILIGRTGFSKWGLPKWTRRFSRSIVQELIESGSGIDVYVIEGDPEPVREQPLGRVSRTWNWPDYLPAIAITALLAGLAALLRTTHIADSEANTVMLFLAGVAWVAYQHGAGPAILASTLSVLLFDFFFVPPYLTFAIADAQYLVTFAVMLAIGLIISSLTSRLRLQILASQSRERRTHALYELGRDLGAINGEVFLLQAASRRIQSMIHAEISIYLRRPNGVVELAHTSHDTIPNHPVSQPAAQWVVDHAQHAGQGTNTLPNAGAWFLPLEGSSGCLGALAIRSPGNDQGCQQPDPRRTLESCCHQLAFALERDRLAIDAAEAKIQADAEQLRSTLLSSVSHDLRTPLATIYGASSALLDSKTLSNEDQRELLQSIESESKRLHRMLENILHMTRLDADAGGLTLQWHVLEDIVGSSLRACAADLAQRPIDVQIPEDTPLVHVDPTLLEQVFVNLFENACKYTPRGTPIAIAAAKEGDRLRVSIRDRGPGLAQGTEERIFSKFYRASNTPDTGRSCGLGLAICRAIMHKLGGTISASSPPGGGAEFILHLPLLESSPTLTSPSGSASPLHRDCED